MSQEEKRYTWVQTHKELVEYLKTMRDRQKELVELLRLVGIDGLKDIDEDGNEIELEVIDPFSFFCYIYKYSKRRLHFLKKIAEKLNLAVPSDTLGVPSAQAQKVNLFPYQDYGEEGRTDEIDRLWTFFFDTLDDDISEEQFQDILNIYGIGTIKITEILFYVRPEKYLPVNGPTKPYLKEVLGIDPSIETYTDYLGILEQVGEKAEQSFYELSHVAWEWNESRKETQYWVFQCNPSKFDVITSLQNDEVTDWTVASHKDKISPGDKVILWVTGDQAGCYALCETTSEVYQSDDKKSYTNGNKEGDHYRVDLEVTHNLVNSPILQEQIDAIDGLSDLNAGHQGTNFSATQEEYETLLELAEGKNERKFWLYAPGRGANMWDEYYNEGIMAIGWDDLGDLSRYKSKSEVVEKLQDIFDTDSSKKNDATATWDFSHEMSPGDVIIAKRGKSEYIGYGIVSSDYRFEDDRDKHKHIRKVDWKKKGFWEEPDGDIVTKTLTDITKYPEYVDKLVSLIGIGVNKPLKPEEKVNYSLNTILYGPPGTGKTYHTVKRAAEIVEQRKIDHYVEAQEIFNDALGETIEFITFHQNYSYEDFIEGLRPDVKNSEELTFIREDGIFKKLAQRALKNLKESGKPKPKKQSFEKVFNAFIEPLVQGEVEELEVEMKRVSFFITNVTNRSIEFRKASGGTAHTLSINTLQKMYEAESVLEIQGLSSYYSPLLKILLDRGKSDTQTEVVKRKNFVLIIDEINRANISKVFGELITLIEPDKRSEGEFRISAKLPSGENFVVPSNLYLIGTMNTADKSIALLDIALRRRFDFEAMYPKYEIDGEELPNADVLRKINERIIKLKGHDFQIGHSYFMNDKVPLTKRMNRQVIPLLLEYFMNDENDVKDILSHAGLKIEEGSWPLKITGRL